MLTASVILMLTSLIFGIQKKNSGKAHIFFLSLLSTLLLIHSIPFLVADYFTGNGFNDAVIFHLQYGLKGAGFVEYQWLLVLSFAGCIAAMITPYLILRIFSSKNNVRVKRNIISHFWFIAAAFLINPTTIGASIYIYSDLISHRASSNDFNDFYRPAELVQISKKRNIVYIYAESLERTYFNEELFPGLTPNLKKLESIGTSFTQIKQVVGTGWTIGGMTAAQCAIPLFTPSHGNSMSGMDTFLPKAICLGDLLAKEKYQLTYLSGTPLEFAGNGKLYRSHGFKEVLGKKYLLPLLNNPSYRNSWGLYDDTLLDITLDRFKASSKSEKPFGLFVSTMDTHSPNGFMSKSCEGLKYKNDLYPILNAIACSDYLITKLVDGILNSEYAENTIIVVASDHLSMRNPAWKLLTSNPFDRRNTLIIIDPRNKVRETVSKVGSMLDIAPTILPYLGFKGDIGLGRDLRGGEESLSAKFPGINNKLKSWAKALRSFWEFPIVNDGDSIFIDDANREITINNRQFKFPVLIEFDKNNTIFRFQFNTHQQQNKLTAFYKSMDPETPFLWLDNCTVFSQTSSYRKNETCIKYGNTHSLETQEFRLTGKNLKLTLTNIKNVTPLKELVTTEHIIKIDSERFNTDRFIAHAGGAIDNSIYTNSLDSLNLSYKNGFRKFEIDIIKTSDGIFVGAHDWEHWKKNTNYEGDLPPTHKEFKKYKFHNQFLSLDLDDINDWFADHPETILVTDKVNTPAEFSKLFVDKNRLVMELFTIEALQEGLNSNILSAMPTWGIISSMEGNKVQKLIEMGVKDIAASRRVIQENIPLLQELHKQGIKVYVFHVNFNKGKSENYVVCNEMDYIYGLYADEFDFNAQLKCN